MSIAWRGAAVLYALTVAVLSLLPSGQLGAWAPLARGDALDRGITAIIVQAAAGAGLVLLIVPILARASGARLKVGPRLRLSRSLSLALIVYVTSLALMASGDLRAAARGIALGWLPAWFNLAAEHLSAGHVMAYAGLGLLLALGWGRRVDLRLLGLAVLVLGGVLEVGQGVVPGRSPNWWDLLADGLGAAVGLTAGGMLIGVAGGTRGRPTNGGGRPGALARDVRGGRAVL